MAEAHSPSPIEKLDAGEMMVSLVSNTNTSLALNNTYLQLILNEGVNVVASLLYYYG
jgi:hypothetical protein